jgi:hypothetical protein
LWSDQPTTEAQVEHQSEHPDDPKGPGDRGQREVAGLARHLNASYPDTLAFLARVLLARSDVEAATLEDVTEQELVLRSGAGEELRVPLAGSPGDPLRPRLMATVQQARAAAGADEPLTGLEQRARHDG